MISGLESTLFKGDAGDHKGPHRHGVSVQSEGKRPTPGRPQGSPLRTTLPPPLQRNGTANALFGVFVRAGAVRMRGWDPSPFVLPECVALDARASLARRVGASGRPGGLWTLN